MPVASPKSELFKIFSVFATIPACFLIFSGGYVLMRFGPAHAARDLFIFGALPLLGGFCWLFLASWLWSRAVGAVSVWESVRIISLRAFGAIALACVAVLIARKLHGH